VQAGIEKDEITEFRERLERCGLNSVDAFLKKNPVFGRTAKLRIAQELCAAEYQTARGVGRTETWVQYLFSHFLDGDSLGAFTRNKCTFVTLNYDRSLEFELTRMLSNSYREQWKAAAEAVRALKIIHLHGSIGTMPDDERLYGTTREPGEVQDAARGILTLGEPGSDKEYAAAKKCLDAAEVVFCLGFGFHGEIIENLDIRGKDLPEGRRANNLPAVHGTCQGLTQSEVNRVTRQFAPPVRGIVARQRNVEP